MSDRITLQTTLGAEGADLKDVSLITTGMAAEGHGIYLDDKTAEGVMKRLLGRSVKSYLRHEGASGDRLGQEIGFFSGIYRQGAKIKAGAFSFLDSFRKEAAATAEKLLELARKVPDQFGVSLVLEHQPVWVLPDGTELPARRGDPAPAGALHGMPVMRVLDVISADFVGRPAANPTGLLSQPEGQVDAATLKQPAPTPPMPDQSPAAPVTATAATVETVTENHVALEKSDYEAKLAELAKSHETALGAVNTKVAELEAKIAEKDKAHTTALEALTKSHADAIAKLEADHAAKLKEAEGFDARKLGIAPVKIAALQHAAGVAALNTPAEKLAFYRKLEAGPERTAFRNKHWNELIEAEAAEKTSGA